MEYTAVKMFAQLAERQSQHGVQLWLIGMTPQSSGHRTTIAAGAIART